eukprot:8104978-Pyramimonas_sp.AAC.1
MVIDATPLTIWFSLFVISPIAVVFCDALVLLSLILLPSTTPPLLPFPSSSSSSPHPSSFPSPPILPVGLALAFSLREDPELTDVFWETATSV